MAPPFLVRAPVLRSAYRLPKPDAAGPPRGELPGTVRSSDDPASGELTTANGWRSAFAQESRAQIAGSHSAALPRTSAPPVASACSEKGLSSRFTTTIGI